MNAFDVIIIGSGHNGLVTGCYLAKAGLNVCVLEKRNTIGGAVSTETMFKSGKNPHGFRMDVGSSVHIMIHHTDIIEELGLHNYGLDYIEMDPFMSYPVPDTKGVIHFFRDLDRTVDSIAKIAPGDADNYKRFIEFWTRVNRGVLKTFLLPPTGKNLIMEMVKGQLRDGAFFKRGEQAPGLQKILSSYGKVVDDAFENRHLKAALIWYASQSGPTPDMTATGDFAGWLSMIHQSGAWHPRGGSGMLTKAMASFIENHGGTINSGQGVQKILIKNGRAYGVTTDEGFTIEADIIVSNAHVQTTMLNMVGPEHLGDSLVKRVENIAIGNGIGMVIRCAVSELPEYTSCPADPFIHNGMQLLAPSVEYLDHAVADYKKGIPPEYPPVLAMTFSGIDPDMAMDGNHVLYAWAQWFPYELRGGLHWDDIREREAQKIYDVITRYAPNMHDKLLDWHIQTPLDIERKHGMLRGNVMHVDMSLDQMFMFRPTPELSRYETPVENLYLSSASCHPGGGVFGAAGYNSANVILKKHKFSL